MPSIFRFSHVTVISDNSQLPLLLLHGSFHSWSGFLIFCPSRHLPASVEPMAPEIEGKAIVIMGVSGSGKTTVGNMLANATNSDFLDADDFHPLSNKEKMRHGVPLSDEDRIPWLQYLRDALRESIADGRTVVLGCSALRSQYREILRSADPHYKLGSYDSSSIVNFVLLDVKAEVLVERLTKRATEGTHFMPVSLLQSQLDLLQIEDSEGICKVGAALSPQAVVDTILNLDFMKKCT